MKRCMHSLNLLPHVVPLKPSAQSHVQFSELSVPPFTQLREQPESRKKQERMIDSSSQELSLIAKI